MYVCMQPDYRANQLHATMHRSLQNIRVVEVCMLLIVLNDRFSEFTCVNNWRLHTCISNRILIKNVVVLHCA